MLLGRVLCEAEQHLVRFLSEGCTRQINGLKPFKLREPRRQRETGPRPRPSPPPSATPHTSSPPPKAEALLPQQPTQALKHYALKPAPPPRAPVTDSPRPVRQHPQLDPSPRLRTRVRVACAPAMDRVLRTPTRAATLEQEQQSPAPPTSPPPLFLQRLCADYARQLRRFQGDPLPQPSLTESCTVTPSSSVPSSYTGTDYSGSSSSSSNGASVVSSAIYVLSPPPFPLPRSLGDPPAWSEIGRATCRERVS